MFSFCFILSLEVKYTHHLLFFPVTYVSLSSTVSPSSPLLYNYSHVVMAKVETFSVWKLFCLDINRSFCRELTIHTAHVRNCRTVQVSKLISSTIVDQRTLLFGGSLISLSLKERENDHEATGKDQSFLGALCADWQLSYVIHKLLTIIY